MKIIKNIKLYFFNLKINLATNFYLFTQVTTNLPTIAIGPQNTKSTIKTTVGVGEAAD